MYYHPTIEAITAWVISSSFARMHSRNSSKAAGNCDRNPNIDLMLTRYGGHVGYFSSQEGQLQAGDPDPWWAWNRVLEWCGKLVISD